MGQGPRWEADFLPWVGTVMQCHSPFTTTPIQVHPHIQHFDLWPLVGPSWRGVWLASLGTDSTNQVDVIFGSWESCIVCFVSDPYQLPKHPPVIKLWFSCTPHTHTLQSIANSAFCNGLPNAEAVCCPICKPMPEWWCSTTCTMWAQGYRGQCKHLLQVMQPQHAW